MTRNEFLELYFICNSATATFEETIDQVQQLAKDNSFDANELIADLKQANEMFNSVFLEEREVLAMRYTVCLFVTEDELKMYKQRDHNLFTFESKTHNTKCAKLSDKYTFKNIVVFK